MCIRDRSTDGASTGNNAAFDVNVSSTGDVSLVINDGGIGYYNTETLSIADSAIGNSGAPAVTFDVSGLGGFQYNNVATTNSGNGNNALKLNVTIDGAGAATAVTVGNNGGLAYAINNTITIADSVLGNNGAPALTCDVATIVAPQTYSGVAATSTTGSGSGATFDVTIDANGAVTLAVATAAGLG